MVTIIVALVLFIIIISVFHNLKKSKFDANYKTKVIVFSIVYFISMSIIFAMVLTYYNSNLYHKCDHSENIFLIYLCVIGVGAVLDIFKDATYEDIQGVAVC